MWRRSDRAHARRDQRYECDYTGARAAARSSTGPRPDGASITGARTSAGA
jgi:hypothetical protein